MTNEMKKYDLIAIGTGSAGSTAAYGCKSAGWSVAIIDSRPFGGTCALRGCDPKKVLVGAAEIIDRSINMKAIGIVEAPKLNWSDLMRFKRTIIEHHSENSEKGYAKAGIDIYHGQAIFTGKNTLKVNEQEIEGKHIIIATGATPMKLNIPGEEYITLSDQFLELDTLPEDITFIGGGFISFEFAHVAARAGAKVRILHRSARPLKNFDRDLVDMLLKEFEDIGIDIILNTPVNSIEKKDGKLVIDTGDKKFETDMVVHGAGRVPDVENLNLEKTEVIYDRRGIAVNEYLQTSNPSIYAGGDSAAIGLPLTPVAGLHGRVIAQNLLEGNTTKVDHTATASVAFTFPPLASVGLTEEQAKEKGINFKTNFAETSSWYNPKRIGLKHSGYKILIDKDGYIVGAHLLYPNADDVINIFLLAIKNKIKSEDLKNYLWAYPSNVYDIKYMV